MIIIYGAILVVLVTVFLFLSSLALDEEVYNWFASFITTLAVVLAPFAYFLRTKRSEYDERTRASKNLYTELDTTLEALTVKNYPNSFKVVEYKNGVKYYFTNRMLNHDFYDSLIFSGKINFLPTAIQQKTQDVFHMIKDHNSSIRSIRAIEDGADLNEDVSPKTRRYHMSLHSIEVQLMAEDGIPMLKTKLRKEFKIF